MTLNDVKWKIKFFYTSNPFIYSNLTKLAKKKKTIVNGSTHLVVEGYPRCGNTFAVALLQTLNPDIRIARHRHEPGHIKLALSLKKPVVVLLRSPVDAVISFHIRENVSLETALNYYLYFHKHLLQMRRDLLIIDFNELTKEPNRFISKINSHYNLNFPIPSNRHIERAKKLVSQMDSEEMQNNRYLKKSDISLISSVPSEKKRVLKENIVKKIKDCRQLRNKLEASNKLFTTLKDSL